MNPQVCINADRLTTLYLHFVRYFFPQNQGMLLIQKTYTHNLNPLFEYRPQPPTPPKLKPLIPHGIKGPWG